MHDALHVDFDWWPGHLAFGLCMAALLESARIVETLGTQDVAALLGVTAERVRQLDKLHGWSAERSPRGDRLYDARRVRAFAETHVKWRRSC